MNLVQFLWSGAGSPDWRDLRKEKKVRKLNTFSRNLFVEVIGW